MVAVVAAAFLLCTVSATAYEADYVIVGAGAAGSTLAGKLARAGKSVLVLEGGKRLFDDPSVYQPYGTLGLYNSDGRYAGLANDPAYTWQHVYSPDAGRYGQRFTIANGRMWGGGSMMNTGIWVNGGRALWNHDWPSEWAHHHVSPYMMEGNDDIRPYRQGTKSEATRVYLQSMLDIGRDQANRGSKRNWFINSATYPSPAVEDPTGTALLEYNDAAGINDVCAFANYYFTNHAVDAGNGTFRRYSAGNAFLEEDCVDADGQGTADLCRRLEIVSEAIVHRVTFSGKRASGAGRDR